MKTSNFYKGLLLGTFCLFDSVTLLAQADITAPAQSIPNHNGSILFLIVLLIILLGTAIFLKIKTTEFIMTSKKKKQENEEGRLNQYINNMDLSLIHISEPTRRT